MKIEYGKLEKNRIFEKSRPIPLNTNHSLSFSTWEKNILIFLSSFIFL